MTTSLLNCGRRWDGNVEGKGRRADAEQVVCRLQLQRALERRAADVTWVVMVVFGRQVHVKEADERDGEAVEARRLLERDGDRAINERVGLWRSAGADGVNEELGLLSRHGEGRVRSERERIQHGGACRRPGKTRC